VTFNSQTEASAFESVLQPIQASANLNDLNNGWYCPSADPNRPCPANAPNYTLCLNVAGSATPFCSGEQRTKGLGLRLPNDSRTFNVMSYNYRAPVPDPNDAQQTTPGISLSQMEQIASCFGVVVRWSGLGPRGRRNSAQGGGSQSQDLHSP
jgi:hypothetical protein